METSKVVLLILLPFVLISEVKHREENTHRDIEYVAPSGVRCVKCSPGTHLQSHCDTENTNSRCQLCEDGTFTSEYNIAEYCEPCMESCETPELVPVVNCSPSSNLKCECPNGKFNLFPHLDKYHAVCQEFGLCEPGYGVYVKGTSITNTTCTRCVPGITFSSTTSAIDECQPCAKCEPSGILTECTLTQNRKCNKTLPVQHRDVSAVDWKQVLIIVLSVVVLIIILSALSTYIFIRWLRKSKKWCFKEEHGPEKMIGESTTDSVSSQLEIQVCDDPRSEPVAQNLSSTSSQPIQTTRNRWEPSFNGIMQRVVDHLITYGHWQSFIREFYQVSTHNSNIIVDVKIAEIKKNCQNDVREQIYQCLKYIFDTGATTEMLIDALNRKECHSLVAVLLKDFPDAFKPVETDV